MPQFWDFSRRERSFTICPNRQSPTAQDEYERTQKVELLRDYFCNLCYIHLWPCNAQGGRPPAEPFDRWCLELMASADLGMEACAENMPDPWLKNVKECFNSKGLRRGLLAEIPWRPKRVKQKSKGGMIDTSFDIAIARQWLQLFEQLLKPHKSKSLSAHRYYCGLKSMRVYLLQTAAGRRQYPIRPQFLKELQLAFLNVGADVDSEVCSISISPTINFQKKGSTSSNWTHSSSSNWTHSGSSNWTHSGSSNWTQVDSAGSQSFDNLQIPASPPPFRGSPKRGATHHLTGNQFPTNQNLFRSLTKYESPATDNNWRNSNDRPPKQSNLRPPDKSKSWRSSN
eukprot:Platyproteum_vivax@DN6005_c0_g1_i4.p1